MRFQLMTISADQIGGRVAAEFLQRGGVAKRPDCGRIYALEVGASAVMAAARAQQEGLDVRILYLTIPQVAALAITSFIMSLASITASARVPSAGLGK